MKKLLSYVLVAVFALVSFGAAMTDSAKANTPGSFAVQNDHHGKRHHKNKNWNWNKRHKKHKVWKKYRKHRRHNNNNH